MCAIPLSFRFSLDFACFPSILVLSRERRARKGITYMKKLITIILALIMTLFAAPNQGADQAPVTAVETPQTAIITQAEQVPEESEKPAETALVSEVKETGIVTEAAAKEEPIIQETVTEECTEITEGTVITEKKVETVECIDNGDQNLAEYKPQIGGQTNPFENNTPASTT